MSGRRVRGVSTRRGNFSPGGEKRKLWKFETYIKKHKIALFDIGKPLADFYENIDYYPLYRPLRRRAEKTLFKLYEHIPNFLKCTTGGQRWYDEWKDHIEEYDTIIIGNDLRGRDVIEYIKARNPKARIIVYYTSLVGDGNRKDPRRYTGLDAEFFSFDEGDSKRFGIRYQPYCYDLLISGADESPERGRGEIFNQDVFFVGMAYDRAERLIEVHKLFEEQGIKDRLVIVRNPHRRYNSEVDKYLTDAHMTYDEVVQAVRESRAVLEILQGGQRGISLRPMEAITFKKKLITDNTAIKEYNLYNPENVFIIGEDPVENLRDFVFGPYAPVPESVLDDYTPQHWLDALLGLG